jgi:mannosyl-3-phosphoglycerate phosphatase family protein
MGALQMEGEALSRDKEPSINKASSVGKESSRGKVLRAENQVLIFTDLDGTLLDHNSYDFQPAVSILHILEEARIPVIPVTSKTRAELLELRQQLNNPHPFVVENGAAVFIPKSFFSDRPDGTDDLQEYWVQSFAPPRSYWQELLKTLSAEFPGAFATFTTLGIEGIQKYTGLSRKAAELANEREFSEPVLWLGDEETREAFKQRLLEDGIWIVEGGRFMHLSTGCDKGKAVEWLKAFYQARDTERPIHTIALGDSHNDLAMLEASDQPIIIRSPTKHPPELRTSQTVIRSHQTGPEGWADTISRYLGFRVGH